MNLINRKFYKSKFLSLRRKKSSIFINNDNDLTEFLYEICSYCKRPFDKRLWCKECDPNNITKNWTSGNPSVDDFIKDTLKVARSSDNYYFHFLEWIPYDKLKDIKEIGEGDFFKVYSSVWIDGKSTLINGKIRKVEDCNPMIKVALKVLKGSQGMPDQFLHKLKFHWDFCLKDLNNHLKFYGISKDPKTEEFIIVTEFAERGNLRDVLSNNFHNLLWKDKISLLLDVLVNLNYLHNLGYFHKNLHSGNILQDSEGCSYISDFGLSGSKFDILDDKIYGVLPYIAPEVLNDEPHSLSSDIYSFGIIMVELSSGRPPFYNRNHDLDLAMDIYNGLRPKFGKGTPEIYKTLARRCMSLNPDERPTVEELDDLLKFWYKSIKSSSYYQDRESFGYKVTEIKDMFKVADKGIQNISISYKKHPGAIYYSRAFTFND